MSELRIEQWAKSRFWDVDQGCLGFDLGYFTEQMLRRSIWRSMV